MILRTGKPKNNQRAQKHTRAFTLIELIVVMGLLTSIFALSVPHLSRFFKGRNVLEEARRFLTITRYAQNQVKSWSIPLEIRFDTDQRVYGVTPLAGYEDELENEPDLIFEYDDDIQFEFRQNTNAAQGDYTIVFGPDGTLDDLSLFAVTINKENESPVFIVQQLYGTGYEIVSQEDYERREKYQNQFQFVQ